MRSAVSDFVNGRTSEAMGLKEGDSVVKVLLGDNHGELFLVTHQGQAIRYSETEINPMGRKSRGVKGMALGNEDWIVDALLLSTSQNSLGDLVTVTERGFVKRTSFEEYKHQGRAGKGIAIGKVDPVGTGFLMGVTCGSDDDVLYVIQSSGTVTQIEMKDVNAEPRAKVGAQLVPIMLNDYTIRIL